MVFIVALASHPHLTRQRHLIQLRTRETSPFLATRLSILVYSPKPGVQGTSGVTFVIINFSPHFLAFLLPAPQWLPFLFYKPFLSFLLGGPPATSGRKKQIKKEKGEQEGREGGTPGHCDSPQTFAKAESSRMCQIEMENAAGRRGTFCFRRGDIAAMMSFCFICSSSP
jgi:hypothetical protein